MVTCVVFMVAGAVVEYVYCHGHPLFLHCMPPGRPRPHVGGHSKGEGAWRGSEHLLHMILQIFLDMAPRELEAARLDGRLAEQARWQTADGGRRAAGGGRRAAATGVWMCRLLHLRLHHMLLMQ